MVRKYNRHLIPQSDRSIIHELWHALRRQTWEWELTCQPSFSYNKALGLLLVPPAQRVWFFPWPHWHLDGPKISITSFALMDVMWCGVYACILWRFVDFLFLNSFQGRPHVVCTGVLRSSHYLLSMLPLSPTNLVYIFPTTKRFTMIEGVITYKCTSHSIQHTSPKIVRNMHVIILDWIVTKSCFQDPELV
jgi:hypothetical protein